MNTTNYLKEMSWTSFVERKKQTNLVILPSGALEVYGPHLPLGTDALVASKITEMVAKRVNAIISPIMEAGDSSKLDEFPGTITIQPESFKAYLADVVKSLIKWGFKDFLFINSHSGNVSMINQVSGMFKECTDIRFAQINYWSFIQSLDHNVLESREKAYGHAAEAGTSVMMHLYPDLVDENQFVNEMPRHRNAFPEITQYLGLSNITASGVIGNAKLASQQKGEIIVDKSVDRIVSFLNETWGICETY